MTLKTQQEVGQYRSKIKKTVFERLIHDKQSMVELATGVGKSTLAMDFIKFYHSKKGKCDAIILVDSSTLRTQWKERYVNKLGEGYNVLVETVHEACEKSIRQFDVVIFDEGDAYAEAPLHGNVYSNCIGKYRLVLSAYYSGSVKETLFSKGFKLSIQVSRDKAEKMGLISITEVHNILIPMSIMDKAKLSTIQGELMQYLSFFPDEMGNDMFNCKSPKFREVSRKLGIDIGVLIHNSKMLKECIDKRRALTYYNDSKIEVAKWLIEEVYPTSKIITFSTSINQAEKLYLATGGSIYHSKLKSALYDKDGKLITDKVLNRRYTIGKEKYTMKQLEEMYPGCYCVPSTKRKEYVINRFTSNIINPLHSAQGLKRGLDIQDCNLGIRTSRFKKDEDTLQSIGRVRDVGIFIELVMEDSNEYKDLKYMQNRLKLKTKTFKLNEYEKARQG